MDGNAKPAGDKPDDLIARQRIAAAGELDEAPLHAVYDHAADRFFVCPRLLLGTLLLHRRLVGFDIFLLELRHDLPKLDAAVANGCIDVVLRSAILTAADEFQAALELFVRQVDAVAPEFALQLGPALHNVLLTALLFKPLADLVARLAGLHNL